MLHDWAFYMHAIASSKDRRWVFVGTLLFFFRVSELLAVLEISNPYVIRWSIAVLCNIIGKVKCHRGGLTKLSVSI